MTTLPSVTNDISFEQLAGLIGQEAPSSGGGASLSLLKINRDHEDDNGRAIPAGSFCEPLRYSFTLKLLSFSYLCSAINICTMTL